MPSWKAARSALAATVVAVVAMRAPARAQTTATMTNPTGIQQILGFNGNTLATNGPFFQPLGTNGRTCASCHVPLAGWSITPSEVQARFTASNGLDPLFRLVDGSNTPKADVSTLAARKSAYSMLLNKAVIRVGLPMPPSSIAEFTLTKIDDPYKFSSPAQLSLFRRPLPSTNLRFLSSVMWDGRMSFAPRGGVPLAIGAPPAVAAAALFTDLSNQAADAIVTHSEFPGPISPDVVNAIVNYELTTATAQIVDNAAGRLDNRAFGGAVNLAQVPFYIGINDVIGRNPTGTPFTPNAMTLFQPWTNSAIPAQASIARGAAIFNLRTFGIRGVGGLNDALNIPVLTASCVACHDTPNVGNQSTELFFDTGVSEASRRTPDMPLYTLTNKTTGAVRNVTDPGRALITGRYADISKFKSPTLRALAGRAPYFHDGSAADIRAVVEFYNTRFNIGYTNQEKADLVAFLKSL